MENSTEATVAAWHLASTYLEDMRRSREALLELEHGARERGRDLDKMLKNGAFSPTGEPGDARPLTVNEICNLHRCALETEKSIINIIHKTVKEANHDVFTEFARRVHAANAFDIKNAAVPATRVVGGRRPGAGRPPSLPETKKKSDPSYGPKKAQKQLDAVSDAIKEARRAIEPDTDNIEKEKAEAAEAAVKIGQGGYSGKSYERHLFENKSIDDDEKSS